MCDGTLLCWPQKAVCSFKRRRMTGASDNLLDCGRIICTLLPSRITCGLPTSIEEQYRSCEPLRDSIHSFIHPHQRLCEFSQANNFWTFPTRHISLDRERKISPTACTVVRHTIMLFSALPNRIAEWTLKTGISLTFTNLKWALPSRGRTSHH